MGIAMVALTRNKSGLWAARKAIPADIRSAYGKREEKKTWPAALSRAQAKAEFAAWLIAIEDRIGMLRAMAGQPSVGHQRAWRRFPIGRVAANKTEQPSGFHPRAVNRVAGPRSRN